MQKRELWLDYLRAFACVLVSFGHLFMSFQEAAIINGTVVSFSIKTIYHFHVYIFFFCSGYLFQKVFSKYEDKKLYFAKKFIKCLDFIILYVVFSVITYTIKVVLTGSVNSPVEDSLLEVLLRNPINQMWYMYAISVITLFTPIIKTDRAFGITLLASLGLKIISCIPACLNVIPLPLEYLFRHQIWYVLGAVWMYKGIELKKRMAVFLAFLFGTLSVLEYVYDISHVGLDAVLTFTGIVASAELFRLATRDKDKMTFIWKLLSKYMLQIYLLHTICAAGIRIILLKLGMTSFLIHFLMGTIFSFAIPIACALIAERIKGLNIVFFPSKTIRELLK